jgi:hypothetical protein
MDDKEKAKALLQYGDKLINVEDLSRCIITESRYEERNEMFRSFEDRFISDTKYLEFNLNIRVVGKVEDVSYLYNLKNCAIVPYPED